MGNKVIVKQHSSHKGSQKALSSAEREREREREIEARFVKEHNPPGVFRKMHSLLQPQGAESSVFFDWKSPNLENPEIPR